MNGSTLRGLITASAFCAIVALGVSDAGAQCATCPPPTVAYSPVVAAPQPVVAYSPVATQVAQPVVLQQAPSWRPRWYPGKYLSRIFRRPAPVAPVAVAPAAAPVAQPTFVTAAYRPTFPPNYSYATYSAVAPAVQTVARPVMLTAVADCCPTTCCDQVSCGAPGCCDGGVTTAGYDAPFSSGCASCQGQSSPITTTPVPGYNDYNGGSASPTPTPAIPPGANVPENRVNRVPFNDDSLLNDGVESGDAGSGDLESDDATSYWNPPQLFDGRDRSAQRSRTPAARVWNAVYRQQGGDRSATAQRTAYRQSIPARPQQRNVQVGASGWRSAD